MTGTKHCSPAVSTFISTLFFPLEPTDAFQHHKNPLLKNKANRSPGQSSYKLKGKKKKYKTRGGERREEGEGEGERKDEEEKMKTFHTIKCPVCGGLNVNFPKGSDI